MLRITAVNSDDGLKFFKKLLAYTSFTGTRNEGK